MERSTDTSELPGAGRTRSFTVTRSHAGWEVREEYQQAVVRTVIYTDWHRVERAMELFKRQEGLDQTSREA